MRVASLRTNLRRILRRNGTRILAFLLIVGITLWLVRSETLADRPRRLALGEDEWDAYDVSNLPLDPAIERHAGVYRDDKAWRNFRQVEGHITPASVERTVLMSTANWGFMEFV
jgi:hypothetical protein